MTREPPPPPPHDKDPGRKVPSAPPPPPPHDVPPPWRRWAEGIVAELEQQADELTACREKVERLGYNVEVLQQKVDKKPA